MTHKYELAKCEWCGVELNFAVPTVGSGDVAYCSSKCVDAHVEAHEKYEENGPFPPEILLLKKVSAWTNTLVWYRLGLFAYNENVNFRYTIVDEDEDYFLIDSGSAEIVCRIPEKEAV